MKSTIEAMKQVKEFLLTLLQNSTDVTSMSLEILALDEAIDREEAQSVEPVGEVTGDGFSMLYGHKPLSPKTKLFTHPAPAAPGWLLKSTQDLALSLAKKHYPEVSQFEVLDELAGVISQIDNMTTGLQRKTTPTKQPLDSERAALIEALFLYSREGAQTDHARHCQREAADMLEADAQDEWHLGRAAGIAECELLNEKLQQAGAQQVAVPQVDSIGAALELEARAKTVESQTTERAMLHAANCLRLLAAPQAAPRVPMTDEQIDSVIPAAASFCAFDVPWTQQAIAILRATARAIEAHHGIVGVKP